MDAITGMDQTVDSARGLAQGANRETPAWLACLDLACAVAAALLWALVPGVGVYPLALVLAAAAARLLVTGRLGRRTAFDAPLALFLLTAGVAVWSAYDRQAAWARLWLIAGGLLLYYALANAAVLGKARAWLPAALGAAVAVYFVGSNDWRLHPGEIAALTRLGHALQGWAPAISGPRLNPNEAGGILAMLLPFAAWVTWDAWRRRTRSESHPLLGLLGPAAGALILGTTLLGLLMTGSRGALLALSVGLYTAGSWKVAGRLAGQRAGRRLWAWLGLLALGALVAALAAAALARLGLLALGAGLLGTDTLLARTEFYRYALLLAKDYAFLGAGLGGFKMLYASYALLTHVGYIQNSHNLYLGVAIDQGIPGLLALVWAWAVLARLAWRQTARQAGPGPLSGVAALSVGVVLVHGFFESALYGTGVFLLFLPLAFALPDGQPRTEVVGPRRKRSLLPGVAVIVLALVLVGPAALLAQVSANLGAVHQGRAELSLYSWPAWPVQDAVRRAVDLSRPVAEFERALVLAPGNGTANRRLGTIELSLGEYKDALRHLEAAYAAEPWSLTTRQLLGEALIVNGHLEEGRALWAGVNNEQKQLELRAFWYGHIGDARREADVGLAAREE